MNQIKIIVPPALSHLICGYEAAVKLKDAGILQCGFFSYFQDEDIAGEFINAGQLLNPTERSTSAFLATELIYGIGHGYPKPDLLHPNNMSRLQDEGTFGVYMVANGKFFMNHADACADFLLQLIDAGATSSVSVNARLTKFCVKEDPQKEHKENVAKFAAKMAKGEPMASPEALQFYKNFKEDIEFELLLLKDE